MASEISFIEQLFGQKPKDLYILLWALKTKTSYWYSDLSAAQRHIESAAKLDIYIGCGLSPRDFGRKARCLAAEIVGIPGLWCDLDIADETAHRKKNLPPTKEIAAQLLAELPIKPTIVVDSGHGLQAWWLFVEPWIFANNEDRTKASDLSRRWTETVRAWCLRKGWTLDATQDLARILRIPGTTNAKVKGAELPVSMYSNGGPRANPSDFGPFLVDDGPAAGPSTRQYAQQLEGELVLSSDATPPFEKFTALIENHTKFRMSWERRRKDMDDQSPSAYDMSLANIAIQTAWSDQETVNLLIAWRRKYDEDLKLRQDYYARTIARARAGISGREEAASASQEIINEAQVGAGGELTSERRAQLLQNLSKQLGIQVTRIVKYETEPPVFYLFTADQSFNLGNSEQMRSQLHFSAVLYGQQRVNIPFFSKSRWHTLLTIMAILWEDEKVGAEATSQGFIREVLNAYVDYSGLNIEINAGTWRTGLPYCEGDHLIVFGANLRDWISKHRSDKIDRKELGVSLHRLGAEDFMAHITIDNQRLSQRAWRVPLSDELRQRYEEVRREAGL